jgi:hypothetical protein
VLVGQAEQMDLILFLMQLHLQVVAVAVQLMLKTQIRVALAAVDKVHNTGLTRNGAASVGGSIKVLILVGNGAASDTIAD